jgi:hypothetical protein
MEGSLEEQDATKGFFIIYKGIFYHPFNDRKTSDDRTNTISPILNSHGYFCTSFLANSYKI